MCSAFLILRYMFDDCNRLFIKKPSIIWCEHKRSNLIWRIHLKIESCYILWWRRHIWYLQHRFKRILESYLNIIPVFVMIRKTGKKERRHDSRPYLITGSGLYKLSPTWMLDIKEKHHWCLNCRNSDINGVFLSPISAALPWLGVILFILRTPKITATSC